DKESSLFDGMDVSITGVAKFAGKDGERLLPSLTKIKELAARAMNEYRAEHPEAIAPHLAAGLREVRAVRGMLSSQSNCSRVRSLANQYGWLGGSSAGTVTRKRAVASARSRPRPNCG